MGCIKGPTMQILVGCYCSVIHGTHLIPKKSSDVSQNMAISGVLHTPSPESCTPETKLPATVDPCCVKL
jgi:hypothetical protein